MNSTAIKQSSHRVRPPGQDRAGFTLIELVTTVAILGILLTVAVPSFTETLRQNRLATHTNEFVTALNLARSEAIKRGGQVVVRKSGTNWESGWYVFYDADEDATYDDDGDATLCESTEDCYLLQQSQALSGGTTIRTASGANYANYIAFSALGAASGNTSGASKDLRFCGSDANTSKARTLSIDTIGRVALKSTTTACP